MRRLAYAIALCLISGATQAQQSSVYAGHWQMRSSGGYKGSLALDGIGGCSYFITSAFITVQATCVIRQMADGKLMIFGSQEGTVTSGPSYGDQLMDPKPSTVQQTVINIIIDTYDAKKMSGYLLASGRKETVQFVK